MSAILQSNAQPTEAPHGRAMQPFDVLDACHQQIAANLERLEALPLPDEPTDGHRDLLSLPGGVANPDLLRADADAVKFVRNGRPYVSASLTSYLMSPATDHQPEAALTASELRILKAIADGKTTRAIATELSTRRWP